MKLYSIGLVVIAFVLGCQTSTPDSLSKNNGPAKARISTVSLPGYVIKENQATSRAGRYEGWLMSSRERYAMAIDLFELVSGKYEAVVTVDWGLGGNVGIHVVNVGFQGKQFLMQHPFLRVTEATIETDVVAGKLSTSIDTESGTFYLVQRHGYQVTKNQAWPAELEQSLVASPLEGAYTGQCGDQEALLQIDSFRFSGLPSNASNWLDQSIVRGRVAKPDDLMCGAGSVCVQRNFTDVSFRLLDGEVELKGRKDIMSCHKTGPQLDCGDCSFTRQDPRSTQITESSERHASAIPRNKIILDRAGKDELPQTIVDTNGEYFGYLHHEARDVYQLVSFSMEAVMDEGEIKGDAVMTAYLGEGDTSEFSVFRFPGVTLPRSGMVHLASESDSILRIAYWRKGIIRGYWFSKSRGRIGEFQLVRDGVPELAAGLKREETLSGAYQSEEWEFAIVANAELAEEGEGLFPLRVYGNAQQHIEGAHHRKISGVRYDVYRGTIGLLLDDDRLITGQRSDEGFDLVWPPGPRFGQKLSNREPATFRLNPDSQVQARRH
jgi:hypothetical protein